MKKLALTMVMSLMLGTANAETKLGLPSPNDNCFHYQVVKTGEIKVESSRATDYSAADIGGYTFSNIKGLVPFIKENKIKGFSFKGEPTPQVIEAWHKLCD